MAATKRWDMVLRCAGKVLFIILGAERGCN